VEDGFETTLEGKPRGHRPRSLTGEDEARLIALVCGPAPEGCARWTLQLPEDAWVTLEYTDTKTVSRETIRWTLKKLVLCPWQRREWRIPPKANAEFVAGMEDSLDVYTRERDGKRPLVCMDECPKQLTGETRTPLPVKPGRPACFDTEYLRNGTCDICMFAAPLEGWRQADITEQRTRKDWAEQIQRMVDKDFPLAGKIILVMDNLNTHSVTSLYETFPAEEAKRLRDKLEIHYTPKHGNWLNMAEIELHVINNHGLSERIPDIEQMRKEAEAWSRKRNREACKINWRFTTADARIKLKHLYPQFK
jgi:transposase